MIGSDLLRYAPDQRFMVFDFETNHLNLTFGLPWQVSFLIADQKRIYEEHDYYVKWDNLGMSADAARITGFSEAEYLARALDPREVLATFERYAYDQDLLLVGHNILGFDTMIHGSWRRHVGMKPDYSYMSRCIDTNALSKALKKGIPIDRASLLAFQYRMASVHEKGLKSSLSTMAREFDIPFDEKDLHRGNKDILLNWEVWKKLIWAIDI